MIGIGPAGTFAAPAHRREEPPADQFRPGDVWLNSRGTRHRVIRVEFGRAHMVNESTSRTCNRAWDDLGWSSGKVWVRVSCGGEPPIKPRVF